MIVTNKISIFNLPPEGQRCPSHRGLLWENANQDAGWEPESWPSVGPTPRGTQLGDSAHPPALPHPTQPLLHNRWSPAPQPRGGPQSRTASGWQVCERVTALDWTDGCLAESMATPAAPPSYRTAPGGAEGPSVQTPTASPEELPGYTAPGHGPAGGLGQVSRLPELPCPLWEVAQLGSHRVGPSECSMTRDPSGRVSEPGQHPPLCPGSNRLPPRQGAEP